MVVFIPSRPMSVFYFLLTSMVVFIARGQMTVKNVEEYLQWILEVQWCIKIYVTS